MLTNLELSSSCVCAELSWKARNMDNTCIMRREVIRGLLRQNSQQLLSLRSRQSARPRPELQDDHVQACA